MTYKVNALLFTLNIYVSQNKPTIFFVRTTFRQKHLVYNVKSSIEKVLRNGKSNKEIEKHALYFGLYNDIILLYLFSQFVMVFNNFNIIQYFPNLTNCAKSTTKFKKKSIYGF